jgi:hypothetical protein
MSQAKPLQESTRYELFLASAKSDMTAYREKLKGDGSFAYVSQVTDLARLGNNMNYFMLVYLFGDILGNHLNEKFVIQHNRNLLSFLTELTSEYRFFILYELKNNENLFAHG